MSNHQLAIRDFDLSIQIDEKQSEAYYRRGVSKYRSMRYHEAIEDFRLAKLKENELVEDNYNYERNPGIMDGLGSCFHSLRSYHKAF